MVIKNPYQRKYLEEIGIRPVAYNPILCTILGSPTAAILLSQLLYWWDKGRNPEWIYKTIDEMKEETGLTEYEQRTAIRKCTEKGILLVRLAGIPAKRHFRVHLSELDKLVNKYLEEHPYLWEKARSRTSKKSSPSSGEDQELLQRVPSDSTSPNNTSKKTQKFSIYNTRKNSDEFFDIFDGIFPPSNKPDGIDEDVT